MNARADELLQKPSTAAFQKLVDLALDDPAFDETAIRRLETALSQWPDHVARTVSIAQRSNVADRCETLPLYRLTCPLDLLLVPFDAAAFQRAVDALDPPPTDAWPAYGFHGGSRWPLVAHDDLEDAPIGTCSAIGACLTDSYGLAPTTLRLTPDQLRELFAPKRPGVDALEGATLAFHHGDIEVDGDLDDRTLPDVYAAFTGSLRARSLSCEAGGQQFLMLGGDLECDTVIDFNGLCSIDGTLRAPLVRCGGDNDYVCYVGAVDARVAEIRYAEVAAVRAVVALGDGFDPAELVPGLLRVLDDSTLAEIEASRDELADLRGHSSADEAMRRRLADYAADWVSVELPERVRRGDVVWASPSLPRTTVTS